MLGHLDQKERPLMGCLSSAWTTIGVDRLEPGAVLLPPFSSLNLRSPQL